MKFLASFFIVLLFMYALYYYATHFTPMKQHKSKEIDIIETKMIGKNRFLILTRIKDRTFLLSSDESGVKILHEWKENEKS